MNIHDKGPRPNNDKSAMLLKKHLKMRGCTDEHIHIAAFQAACRAIDEAFATLPALCEWCSTTPVPAPKMVCPECIKKVGIKLP